MSGLVDIKRPFAVLALLTSVLALGASIMDYRYNSIAFMEQKSSTSFKRFDDTHRSPSSSHLAKIEASLNKQEIDGEWNVLRITNVYGVDVFDKSGPDENKFIKISMELITGDLVKVDNDLGQLFYISKVEKNGKELTLFKSFNEGQESIVVSKIEKQKPVNKPSTKAQEEEKVVEQNEDNKIKGLRLDQDVDLFLASAINPELSQGTVLGTDKASGRVSLYGRSIVDFTVHLDFGTAQKDLEIGSVEIQDGGVFNADDEVSGIISNNGEVAFNIRIATGELKGTMLKFVTEEEYERIRFQEESARQAASDLESRSRQEAEEITGKKIETNKNDNQSSEQTYDPEDNPYPDSNENIQTEENGEGDTFGGSGELLNEGFALEDAKEKVQEMGFSFGNESRTVASEEE